MPADPPYRPINCDFHDILEATATRRTRARIEFVDESGGHRSVEARIVDIGGRNGAEYMTLETGESVRLDRIVSVDGVRLATFPGDGSTAPDG